MWRSTQIVITQRVHGHGVTDTQLSQFRQGSVLVLLEVRLERDEFTPERFIICEFEGTLDLTVSPIHVFDDVGRSTPYHQD